MSLLLVENLRLAFGGLVAVRDVSFHVDEGDLLGLIGPNGAGKTTLFNLISGVLKPSTGVIRFQGVDIAGQRASRIVRQGLSRTFQSAMMYAEATVLENVVRGAFSSHPIGLVNGLLPSRWRPVAEARAKRTLDLFGLSARRALLARELSYGEQRRLGVAIALASEPRLLMLDEPVAGLNPEEAAGLADVLRLVRRERGVTMVLVEHHMRTVMNLCNRVVVLNQGSLIAAGAPQEIVRDPRVIEAYLGQDAVHA